MKIRPMKVLLPAILALSSGGAAQAQRHFSNEEIVGLIGRCLAENAPDDWQSLSFKMKQTAPGAGKENSPIAEHTVITASAGSVPQDLKPCRPDYVPKAVNTFRENQDQKAKRWTGIEITIRRDGTFSVTYDYPK